MAQVQKTDWLLLVLVSIIWGSSFILIKKGLLAFDPIEVAALRLAWAFVALLPLASKRLNNLKKSDWKFVAIVGVVGSAIPALLFAIAQRKIDSGISGCLNALVPIFTFVWGLILFNGIFQFRKSVGLFIGLSGAMVLILFSNPAVLNTSNLSYAGLILLAGNCYAISINTVKRYCSHIDPIALSFASYMLVAPLAFAIIFSWGTFGKLESTEGAWWSFGALALLGILGTGYASVIFFGIAQRTNALFASTTTYIIPIIALIWAFVDGELLSIWHFAGLALIISGVYLISGKKIGSEKLREG